MQRTKHSIARTGTCRASGEHLIPANEEAALAADRERDHNKGPKLAARDDARALDIQTNGFALQQQLQRDEADRIAGMNWPAIPDLPDPNTNLVAGWTGLSAADLELEP
jgi:hypothetical protein